MKRKGLNSDVIRGASGNIYQASILIPLVVYEGIFDSDGCTPEYQASVFSREESRVKNVTVSSWSCNQKNRTIYYVDAVYRKCILNLCNSCSRYSSFRLPSRRSCPSQVPIAFSFGKICSSRMNDCVTLRNILIQFHSICICQYFCNFLDPNNEI